MLGDLDLERVGRSKDRDMVVFVHCVNIMIVDVLIILCKYLIIYCVIHRFLFTNWILFQFTHPHKSVSICKC